MEYCLWLRGTSGTKNGLRIQNAAIKSRKTAVPAGDDGVAPVIAVAVLIGMVVVAGAIIGFAMFAAMEDAAGTLPDVRFQASADGVSLYHAGGDALPLKSLVFYNTETKENVSVQLTKCGSDKPAPLTEWAVWETGDKIQFGEGVLGVLSIVGLDSRNRPALLWMGSRAMTLPVGDMVPDVWMMGGNSDIPDSKPKYILNNPQSWKELVESAKTKNCNGAGKPLPENTIYWDDKDGVVSYCYQSYTGYLASSDADTDISLQDYFQTKGNVQNMVKIDLSQKVLTYENDTYLFEYGSHPRYWNSENGALVAKKESLCENEGVLYIAIRNLDRSETTLSEYSLWRKIGYSSS